MKIITILLCLILTTCAVFNPNTFVEGNLDLVKADSYPTQKELEIKSSKILLALDSAISDDLKIHLQNELADYFWLQSKIQLTFDEFTSTAELAKKAKSAEIEFYGVVAADLKNTDGLKLLFFHTLYAKKVVETQWQPKLKKSNSALKRTIGIYFPLNGFIIQTKGNREIAQINLGISSGISKGKSFAVFTRTVDKNWQKENSNVVNITSVKYSELAIAKLKIEFADNDSSWAKINPKDRDKVIAGLPVFLITK